MTDHSITRLDEPMDTVRYNMVRYNTVRYGSPTFQPLKEGDLPTLYSWRQEPHVREFVQRQPPTWEEILDKYFDSSEKCAVFF